MPNLTIQRQDGDNKHLGVPIVRMAPSKFGLLSEGLPALTQPSQVRKRALWEPFSRHPTCSNYIASLLQVCGQPLNWSGQAIEEEHWVSLNVCSYLSVSISLYAPLQVTQKWLCHLLPVDEFSQFQKAPCKLTREGSKQQSYLARTSRENNDQHDLGTTYMVVTTSSLIRLKGTGGKSSQ